MIANIIISMLITIYFAWVIWEKRKDTKQGKVCCNKCSDCPIRKYFEK
ncbi:FeoB-associated Cys-rich membrane protein [Anaerovorax odorimutans]